MTDENDKHIKNLYFCQIVKIEAKVKNQTQHISTHVF